MYCPGKKRAKISVGVYTVEVSLVLKQIKYVLCIFLPENLVKTGFNFGYCENMINSVRLQCFDKCARFRLFDIMFRYDLL